MPKATKKKKEKAADFSKAKLKLGKGKKPPANQIDTSFKARSITLPTQSIVLEKDPNAPTTKRKLTFTDLVAHLRHHNSSIKKDALLGLRELFEAYPALIESSLATLIGTCVRLIASEDASVRRALLSFFTWLFPRIPLHSLAPHSSTLLLFTTSGQTHIFPEIRIDAVRFLDLYLETFPDLVVCGWRDGKNGHGRRVLNGYLSILNISTKLGEDGGNSNPPTIAGVALSTASKLVVLRSMSNFLRVALRFSSFSSDESFAASSSNPTWCFSSAFPEPTAYKTFDALFLPATNPGSRHLWRAEVDSEDAEDFAFVCDPMQFESVDASYTLRDLHDAISSTTRNDLYLDSGIGERKLDFEMRLARVLHPTLLSNFLDSAPSVFTPSSVPLQTELGIISAIGGIYHGLYGALLQDTRSNANTSFLSDSLQALLRRMAPYFPFLSSPLVKRDVQIEQTLQDLNIVFCELTSLMVLACSTPPVTQSNTKKRDGMSVQTQISQVKDFVACLLRGVSRSPNTIGRQITAQEYMALLPTLWMLLNSNLDCGGVDEDIDILCVLLDHARQVSSTAAAKLPTVDFIVRLILLETTPRYAGTFRVNNSVGGPQKFEEWVVDLPKTLWELGGTNIPCTEVILRFLLRLFQRRSPIGNTNASVAAQLCARLIPYFTITHPVHGKLHGPFTKLEDTAVQRLALDAVVTIMARIPAEPRKPLDAAVQRAVEGSAHATYWAAATENVLCSA
ncbi:hypothetical protein EDB92DRAFT_1788313 [Lactarius akahatsu]|uniref:Pre-rRNA-processing protein n=1 Tax=Lactarius akahatsu TaxID=416441 RepID=A0AAD4QI27_9AGAM|nr:hypothetical protein EDB92DRAFT_1788313 [Lactarius akahatsu]